MSVQAIMLDVAGVLYTGDTAIHGACASIAKLNASGIPYRLVTNTTRSPKRLVIDRLHKLGFDVAPETVITATQATRSCLRARGLRPYLLVHPAIEEEFEDLPPGPANAVVVGDAGEAFTYDRMNAAFRTLMSGAPLLAIAVNRYFKDVEGLSLDAGPFVAALEYAAQTQAEVLGKPSPSFFAGMVTELGVQVSGITMIGDDVEADVNGALACGLGGILVRTGKFRPGDENRVGTGGSVAENVADAIDRLLE